MEWEDKLNDVFNEHQNLPYFSGHEISKSPPALSNSSATNQADRNGMDDEFRSSGLFFERNAYDISKAGIDQSWVRKRLDAHFDSFGTLRKTQNPRPSRSLCDGGEAIDGLSKVLNLASSGDKDQNSPVYNKNPMRKIQRSESPTRVTSPRRARSISRDRDEDLAVWNGFGFEEHTLRLPNMKAARADPAAVDCIFQSALAGPLKSPAVLAEYGDFLFAVRRDPSSAEKHFREALCMKFNFLPALCGLGRLLLETRKDPGELERVCILALRHGPQHPPTLCLYGRWLETVMLKPEQAQDFYQRAIRESNREFAPALIALADLHRNREDFREAEQLYMEASQVLQDDATALYNCGRMCLYSENKPDRAEVMFKKALDIDGNHVGAMCHYGILLLDFRNDVYQAERMLKLALKVDSCHPETLKAYSRLLDEHFRDMQGALAMSERAYAANPSDAVVLWRLGRLLMDEARDFNRSEAMLRAALDVDLDCVEALYDYGRLLEEIHRDHDSAERMFRRALRADGQHVPSLSSLGLLLAEHRGNVEEAERLYLRALEIDPKDVGTLYNYGILLQEAKDDQKGAESMFQRALAVDPNDRATLHVYGNQLLDVWDRKSEAEDLFRRALQLDPNDVSVLCDYGRLLQMLGRNLDAEVMYERTLRIDPSHEIVIRNYAVLLHDGLKKIDKAAELYSKVLESGTSTKAKAITLCNFARLLQEEKKDFEAAESMYKQAAYYGVMDVKSMLGYAILLSQVRKNFLLSEQFYIRALQGDPQLSVEITKKAIEMRACGEFEGARTAFASVFQLQPSPDTAYQLALTFGDLKDYERAFTFYSTALQLNRSLAPSIFEIGKQYELIGLKVNAFKVYNLLRESEPDNVEILSRLTHIVNDDDRGYCEALFDAALQRNQNLSDSIFERGFCREKSGDTPGALRIYNIVLCYNPQHPSSIRRAAKIYFDLCEFDSSELLFQRAFNIGMRDVQLCLDYGHILENIRNNYTGAEYLYRAAEQLEPANYYILARLANLLHRKLLFHDEAEELYKTCIVICADCWCIEPNIQKTLTELFASLYTGLGDLFLHVRQSYDSSQDMFLAALEYNQEHLPAWNGLLSALSKTGTDPACAVSIASMLIQADFCDEPVLMQHASSLSDPFLAKQAIQQVLERFPNNTVALCRLAYIDATEGRVHSAMHQLQAALEYDRQNVMAFKLLGELQLKEFANASACIDCLEHVKDLECLDDESSALLALANLLLGKIGISIREYYSSGHNFHSSKGFWRPRFLSTIGVIVHRFLLPFIALVLDEILGKENADYDISEIVSWKDCSVSYSTVKSDPLQQAASFDSFDGNLASAASKIQGSELVVPRAALRSFFPPCTKETEIHSNDAQGPSDGLISHEFNFLSPTIESGSVRIKSLKTPAEATTESPKTPETPETPDFEDMSSPAEVMSNAISSRIVPGQKNLVVTASQHLTPKPISNYTYGQESQSQNLNSLSATISPPSKPGHQMWAQNDSEMDRGDINAYVNPALSQQCSPCHEADAGRNWGSVAKIRSPIRIRCVHNGGVDRFRRPRLPTLQQSACHTPPVWATASCKAKSPEVVIPKKQVAPAQDNTRRNLFRDFPSLHPDYKSPGTSETPSGGGLQSEEETDPPLEEDDEFEVLDPPEDNFLGADDLAKLGYSDQTFINSLSLQNPTKDFMTAPNDVQKVPIAFSDSGNDVLTNITSKKLIFSDKKHLLSMTAFVCETKNKTFNLGDKSCPAWRMKGLSKRQQRLDAKQQCTVDLNLTSLFQTAENTDVEGSDSVLPNPAGSANNSLIPIGLSLDNSCFSSMLCDNDSNPASLHSVQHNSHTFNLRTPEQDFSMRKNGNNKSLLEKSSPSKESHNLQESNGFHENVLGTLKYTPERQPRTEEVVTELFASAVTKSPCNVCTELDTLGISLLEECQKSNSPLSRPSISGLAAKSGPAGNVPGKSFADAIEEAKRSILSLALPPTKDSGSAGNAPDAIYLGLNHAAEALPRSLLKEMELPTMKFVQTPTAKPANLRAEAPTMAPATQAAESASGQSCWRAATRHEGAAAETVAAAVDMSLGAIYVALRGIAFRTNCSRAEMYKVLDRCGRAVGVRQGQTFWAEPAETAGWLLVTDLGLKMWGPRLLLPTRTVSGEELILPVKPTDPDMSLQQAVESSCPNLVQAGVFLDEASHGAPSSRASSALMSEENPAKCNLATASVSIPRPNDFLHHSRLFTDLGHTNNSILDTAISTNAALLQAQNLEGLGDFSGARSVLDMALDKDPFNPQLMSDMAALLQFQMNDVDGAEALLKRALAIDPSHISSIFNLAYLMQEFRNNVDGAEDLYSRLLSIDPTHADALNNYALLQQFGRSKPDAAEILFLEALKYRPTHFDTLHNYGFLLHYDLGHYERAEEYYQRALRNNPDSPDTLFCYGDLLENHRRDTPTAEKMYRRALAINANHEDASRALQSLEKRQDAAVKASQKEDLIRTLKLPDPCIEGQPVQTDKNAGSQDNPFQTDSPFSDTMRDEHGSPLPQTGPESHLSVCPTRWESTHAVFSAAGGRFRAPSTCEILAKMTTMSSCAVAPIRTLSVALESLHIDSGKSEEKEPQAISGLPWHYGPDLRGLSACPAAAPALGGSWGRCYVQSSGYVLTQHAVDVENEVAVGEVKEMMDKACDVKFSAEKQVSEALAACTASDMDPVCPRWKRVGVRKRLRRIWALAHRAEVSKDADADTPLLAHLFASPDKSPTLTPGAASPPTKQTRRALGMEVAAAQAACHATPCRTQAPRLRQDLAAALRTPAQRLPSPPPLGPAGGSQRR